MNRRPVDRTNPAHRGPYAINFVTVRDDGRRFVHDTDVLRCALNEVVRLGATDTRDCTVVHRDSGSLVVKRTAGVWTCRDGSAAQVIGGIEVPS